MSETFLAAVATRSADVVERRAAGGPRIWLVSDVHADYRDNLNWMLSLAGGQRFKEDVLILAGDVSNDMKILREVLEALVAGFATVFFTPGNQC